MKIKKNFIISYYNKMVSYTQFITPLLHQGYSMSQAAQLWDQHKAQKGNGLKKPGQKYYQSPGDRRRESIAMKKAMAGRGLIPAGHKYHQSAADRQKESIGMRRAMAGRGIPKGQKYHQTKKDRADESRGMRGKDVLGNLLGSAVQQLFPW